MVWELYIKIIIKRKEGKGERIDWDVGGSGGKVIFVESAGNLKEMMVVRIDMRGVFLREELYVCVGGVSFVEWYFFKWNF